MVEMLRLDGCAKGVRQGGEIHISIIEPLARAKEKLVIICGWMKHLRLTLMLFTAGWLLASCQSFPGLFSTVTPTASVTPSPTITPTSTLTPTATPPPAEACKLPEAAYHGAIGLGFEGYARSLASTGTVRAKVIFADFSDAPASNTPEEIYDLYLDGASEMLAALSYGRLDFQMDPYFKWFRMSQDSSTYGISDFYEHRSLIAEAIELADAEVDFSDVDDVIVILNPYAVNIEYGPTFVPISEEDGIAVDDVVIMNAISSGADLPVWGYKWIAHETGHSMGLVDLYWGTWDGLDYAELFRYTGDFSLMSNVNAISPEPLAYERWLLGWLDDNQIYCMQTHEETVGLNAIELASGTKAVMVPVGPTKAVVIESRRALGYDEYMAEPGALVYTVDTSVYTGQGPIVVWPQVEGDPYRSYAPLSEGESVTVEGVTVTVLDALEDGDLVRVTVSQ